MSRYLEVVYRHHIYTTPWYGTACEDLHQNVGIASLPRTSRENQDVHLVDCLESFAFLANSNSERGRWQ